MTLTFAPLGSVSAQEEDGGLAQAINLSGSLRAGYYGSSRNLDGRKNVGTGAIWLKSASELGSDASLQLEGWIRNDDSFRAAAGLAKLREGYLNYAAGDSDWRIGRQIIVWGRADIINPTDNITPRNYTLLTPETDDQRLGAGAAKMTYHLSEAALTVIWLPHLSPSIYPIPSRPGITITESVPQGGGGAIKLDHTGEEGDWSVSWFNGFDLGPDLKIGASGPSGTNLILQHRRIRVLGMDGALTTGRYGLRAEAAYTWTDNPNNDPLIKQPFLYVVFGGDRAFSDDFNVNLQYYFRRVTAYHNPETIADPLLRSVAIQEAVISNQTSRFQQGITVRVGGMWLNQTLEAEVAGIASLTGGDFVFRPKISYAITDQWKGTVGADIFRGGANTFYGSLRDNSSLFAEIKYGF